MMSPQEFYDTLDDKQKLTFVVGMSEVCGEHKALLDKYNKLAFRHAGTCLFLVGMTAFAGLTVKALMTSSEKCRKLEDQIETLKNEEES